MKASPVCIFDGDNWIPGPLAKGPFPGLHGGVSGGLLAAAMERQAAELGAGDGLQMSLSLLRPTPMAPIQVSVRTLRQGRRSLQLSAELTSEGKLCAVASGLFLTEELLPFIPERDLIPAEVGGEPFHVGRVTDAPWFFEACEMRREESGRIWMRHRNPVVEDMGGLARVLSLADWATGLSRPDWVDRNKVMFPNPEITIHLQRPIEGEWLAVDSQPHWNPSGLGITTSDLYDTKGYLGRATQPVVLAVME
ncbi:MAG: thioesterase family protein [Nisaea sp.]|uniref:thioesterase family protein n=1 Tax=Nisaea sp. TaxID=2024842 RepID=UPI001B10FE63|nr:thioesterase family protein [Nisaea sp.]MBO6562374.1 thioesterase family protein [Nisaea sp.]